MRRSMTGFEKFGCRMIPKGFGVVSTIHSETTNNCKSAIIMMALYIGIALNAWQIDSQTMHPVKQPSLLPYGITNRGP
ncbi:hypothetical protein EMIT0347P_30191 [Pseudomonas sp. IT-347P]